MINSPINYQTFEVFIQRTHLENHIHVGSLVAPSAEMALQTARENFLRREKAVNIWVVPCECVIKTAYRSDFFTRETDRNYREVAGYTENGRLWRRFKEQRISNK